MQVQEGRTVQDLVSANPSAARILEKFGIDYCCGGAKSLAEACSAAQVNLEAVTQALEEPPLQSDDRDWQGASLQDLVRHILEKHHEFTRQEIKRLMPLIAKVVKAHASNHPELGDVQMISAGLAQELTMHIMKEERILFPYIEQLEAAVKSGRQPERPMFGTVQNPVKMMMTEHHTAGEALREIREVTNSYTLLKDACMSYKMLYAALQEFETNLHQHIHLENNILFPRAVALEDQTG